MRGHPALHANFLNDLALFRRRREMATALL